MIDQLPLWISLLFLFAWMGTIGIFHYANGKPRGITGLILLWSLLHAGLAYTGFYQNTSAIPPRFGLILLPATLFIIIGLLPRQQAWFLATRNMRLSTFLHTVRVPVEVVLWGLFHHQLVPELMTFEGRNFDILAGLTAPIVGYLYGKGVLGKKGLLMWNIMGLLLVTFILVNGVLSAELPFQQFAFEQPNRGITYFPFVLLPATIVPIVMWTHLSDIIKLRRDLRGGG